MASSHFKGIKAVILDMDGVIYRGRTLIAGADKAIAELKKRGIKIAYLTNACTRSRKGRVEKLASLGIDSKEIEFLLHPTQPQNISLKTIRNQNGTYFTLVEMGLAKSWLRLVFRLLIRIRQTLSLSVLIPK